MQLTHVPLPSATAHSAYAGDACLFVGEFVTAALGDHCYDVADLPYGAVCFADLWEYYGQVENGGHAYFIFNVGEEVDRWHRAGDLLGRMDLPAYRAILQEVVDHAARHADHISDLFEDGRRMEAIEPFYPFDDRFAALEAEEPLERRMYRWLLRQPWVRIVDHPAVAGGGFGWVRAHIPQHPDADARRAARARRGIAETRGSMLAFLRRVLDLSAKRRLP